MEYLSDYDHLLQHAQRLFPGAKINVTYYMPPDVIYIHVDDRRFAFEIGSDDDAYIFADGDEVFEIPLMEIPADIWDFS